VRNLPWKMSERPLKKKRLEDALALSSSGLLNFNPSSTHLTVLHQQQQIESLQAELDHERAARSLDAKKSAHAIQRLELQVSMAASEAATSKELLDETMEQTERRVQQLTTARDRALQLNRQLQLQLEEAEQDIENAEHNADVDHYKIECQRLQEQVRGLTANEAAYQREVEKLKLGVEQKLRESVELAKTPRKQHPLLEEAPTAVLQELNRCRIQLAEKERQCRQLQHQKEEAAQRSSQLVRDCEKYQQQAKRLPVVAAELQQVIRSYEQAQAEMAAWKEFSNRLNYILASDEGRESLTRGGPPEISTVLRFLETTKKELKAVQQTVATYKTECERLRSFKQEDDSTQWASKQREWEIKLDTLSQQLQTTKQQATLYQREADSLRLLIQTFERQLESGSKDLDPAAQTMQIRLKTDTDQLKLLQTAHDQLAAELLTYKTDKATLAAELDRVREKFGKLRDALMAEKEKVAAAEERAVHAEQLAGKGSFDPQHTRVLHFTETPLVQALKEEVQVLQRQLEAASKAVKTPGTDMKSGLAPNPDKLNQRLKENFKEQIATFREGVYLMTGFKVDMLTTTERPTFRLRSVFAEQEEDHLLLQWPVNKTKDDATSLDILNTDLAKLLATTPSYDYMTKFHSLPAFLASVQLNLFEKQTVIM
jgi:Mitotic checkpoint protein